MARKIFVSYRHTQADFVWNDLVPVLEAGGVEVLLDKERFLAGDGLVGQMDAVQDKAAATVVVLSKQYLKSEYTVHEMNRAVGLVGHKAIPVETDGSKVPEAFKKPDPLLRVNLRNDDSEQWGLLLDSCEAPQWRRKIRFVARKLKEESSVNLAVGSRRLWKPFVRRVAAAIDAPLGQVDLTTPGAEKRRNLVQMILKEFGYGGKIARGQDLLTLGHVLEGKPAAPRLALLRFDMVTAYYKDYGIEFFASLRHLMEQRKLVLLAQSHEAFKNLLPADNPMSALGNIITTVELKGRPR